MRSPHLWIHTNIPAPYRKHQFETFSAAFPQTKVFLNKEMKMSSYRNAWKDDIQDWMVRCERHPSNSRLPKVGRFSFSLLWRLIRQPKGTIHLVGDTGGNFWFILLFCLLRKSRFVIWNDGGFPESITDRYLQLFRRVILPHSVAAFTPGKLGKAFFQQLGFADDRIFNAYFSHDINEYREYYQTQHNAVREYVRRKFDISRDTIVILCVSRFLDWKRLIDLAEALVILEQCLVANTPSVELILIGEGEDKTHESVLQRLRDIRVHYIPQVPYSDIKEYYCAGDIFAFPSEGDIWGLVVNEALSFGVPVICTDRIGSAELVHDGVNGFKISVRAPEQLADRLAQLVNERYLLLKMKTNALRIWDTWNTDLAVAELKRMISTVS
jgi:glycosyltransferase involved in cell wall biosynthesis